MQPQNNFATVLPPAPRTYDRGQPAFLQASPKHLLYFNGSTLILRPLDGSSILHANHICDITAAKFSHGYRHVASVDEKGTLMIHEVLPDRLVESKVFPGSWMGCLAIDWTSDNKKLCMVGSGKNKFGRVISIDTGTDVGNIQSVTANLTTASFRPERPYKLAVGGDDKTVKFYDGPPYKYSCSKSTHTNFVNQIKYSADGKHLVSVSSDRKIVLYEGSTGQVIKELSNAHEAGITGIAWITNEEFVTVSSDKMIRSWDLTLQPKATLPISDSEDQFKLFDSFITAVTHCPQSSSIYCLCRSGEIKEVSKDLSWVKSCFEGHRRKPISILPHPSSPDSGILLDSNGKILNFNLENTHMHRYLRKCLTHNCNINSGCLNSSSGLFYALTSEMIVWIFNVSDGELKEQIQVTNATIIEHCPQGGFICLGRNLIEVYGHKGASHEKIDSIDIDYEPTSILIDKQSSRVFVGNSKGKVTVYDLDVCSLKQKSSFQNTPYRVTCIDQHNDLFFIGDSMGAIKVWKFDGADPKKVSDDMGSHTTVVTKIIVIGDKIHSFAMDNKHSVWNLAQFTRKATRDNIHRGGILDAAVIGGKIVTCGGDYLVKVHLVE